MQQQGPQETTHHLFLDAEIGSQMPLDEAEGMTVCASLAIWTTSLGWFSEGRLASRSKQ
jgi:hypothetical protein